MRQTGDRFAIVLGTSLVAMTLFLVLDIQAGLNLRRPLLPLPENFDEQTKNTIENESKSKQERHSHENNNEQNDYQQINDFDAFAALRQKIGFQ